MAHIIAIFFCLFFLFFFLFVPKKWIYSWFSLGFEVVVGLLMQDSPKKEVEILKSCKMFLCQIKQKSVDIVHNTCRINIVGGRFDFYLYVILERVHFSSFFLHMVFSLSCKITSHIAFSFNYFWSKNKTLHW